MKLGSPQLFTLVALAWVLSSFVACQNISFIDYEQGVWQRLFHETDIFCLFVISSATSFCLLLGLRPVAAAVSLSIPYIAYILAFYCLPAPGPQDIYWQKDSGYVQFEARVEKRLSKHKFIASVTEQTYPGTQNSNGKILVSLRHPTRTTIKAGNILRISGKVKEPKNSNSWGSGGRAGLRRRRIFTRIHALHIEPSKGNIPADPVGESIVRERQIIINAHRQNIGEVRGDLLSSIVLGDRSVSLQKEVKDQFRTVGLSHLLAASGFNLSILVGAIYISTSFLTRSRRLTSAIAIGAIAGFVALAGLSASVSRAALMGVLIVLMRTAYRRANPLSILALTLLLFAFSDPVSLLDVGLELSYAATFAIVVGIKKVDTILSNYNLSRFKKWFIELLAVILLAQSAVLPVQLYYFWEMGSLFLAANLLADPVVAPITVSGFLSSLFLILSQIISPLNFCFSQCSRILDQIASLPLSYMLFLVEGLASFDSCTLYPGPPAPWSILVYFLAFYLLVFNLTNRSLLPVYTGLYFASLSFFFLGGDSTTSWVCLKDKQLLVHNNRKIVMSGKGNTYSINRYLKRLGFREAKTPEDREVFKPSDINLNGAALAVLETPEVRVLTGVKNNRIKPLKFGFLKHQLKVIATCKHKKPWVFWTSGRRPLVSKLKGANTYFVTPAYKFIRIERVKLRPVESTQANDMVEPGVSVLKAEKNLLFEFGRYLKGANRRSTIINSGQLRFILE